ncbi:MAG: methylmalonyl Co-A mutase-associated GTPase MeaB [Myxococcota bacterium]
MSATELAGRLLAGDRAAVPEALNLVDDRRPEERSAALELLEELARAERGEGALRVGLTGAPGAGKSTLLDAIVRQERQRERSVGIIAVDPSSRRTGGALLGDRLRLRSGAADPAVFVRSMAARERLGGLAEATCAGVAILSAVFDSVYVETVGIGQSESDVVHLVDSLVFVTQPDAGDLLQFMKAGILELPDLFVVNKADQGAAAQRTAGELEAGLGLAEAGRDGWTSRVLLVSAREGRGVGELMQGIEDHRRHLEQSGELARRRARNRLAYVLDALERRYGSYGVARIGDRDALEGRLRDARELSAAGLIYALGGEIEDALRKAP